MIIWGTRTYLYTLAMLTFLCPSCHNPSAHALRKRVRKFTLFFIPLFPVSTTWSLQCTFCGHTGSLTKEQGEQMAARAKEQAAQPGAQQGAQQGAQPTGQPVDEVS